VQKEAVISYFKVLTSVRIADVTAKIHTRHLLIKSEHYHLSQLVHYSINKHKEQNVHNKHTIHMQDPNNSKIIIMMC
jgi:hypothetical protein